MWFDAQAELAKLGGEREQDRRPLATTATSATLAPRVANVASVATPSAPEITSHGQTAGGRVTTWTGRVVSLDEWRRVDRLAATRAERAALVRHCLDLETNERRLA